MIGLNPRIQSRLCHSIRARHERQYIRIRITNKSNLAQLIRAFPIQTHQSAKAHTSVEKRKKRVTLYVRSLVVIHLSRTEDAVPLDLLCDRAQHGVRT